MPLTPTISLIELLWTLMGVISVTAHLLNLAQAWANRRAVANAGPTLRATAELTVRETAVTAFVQGVFLLAGVRALFYPPPAGGGWDSAVMGLLFVAAQGALLWAAWRNNRVTARLLAAYRRQRPPPPPADTQRLPPLPPIGTARKDHTDD